MIPITAVLGLYFLFMNIIAFALFGLDKRKAVRHRWRIPEVTLLLFSWIGGGIGALVGMFAFHHKTRKWKFRILVPLSIFAWIAGLVLYQEKELEIS